MKNTQKHTQGPWNVAYYGYTERPVIKHGSQSIADVKGCELDDTTTHSLANARLIAAAPDLLAQLQSIRVELESQALGYTAMEIWPHVRAEMIRRILLTISKAEVIK